MTAPVALSRGQLKAIDRQCGCELALPWPAHLPTDPDLAPDEEQDATPAERAAAEALLAEAIRRHDLQLLGVTAARMARPADERGGVEVSHRLVAHVVARRWADRVQGAPQVRWVDDAETAERRRRGRAATLPQVSNEAAASAPPTLSPLAERVKRVKRRRSAPRLKPEAARASQRAWDLLRAVKRPLCRGDLVRGAEMSDSSAAKLVRRWRDEGLIAEADGAVDALGRATVGYRLARDLGPIAPILSGGMQPGASGYWDPNSLTAHAA